ncbi:hypothetical protein ASC77_00950 [Nocardioides sp. Root1257]|nr:hypothetical protein ASC77_00950 [Nocardioides sp. Root1257]KRC55598.1 hypothetical protein ASE24_00950 [Nocardioides sp. Root224]
MFWLIAGVVAVVLFAIAWWASGRATGRRGRPDPGAETNRGWATAQALINRDTTAGGGPGM